VAQGGCISIGTLQGNEISVIEPVGRVIMTVRPKRMIDRRLPHLPSPIITNPAQ
jgi:hypothetical protein